MIFLYILVTIIILYFFYLLLIVFFPVLKAEELPFKKVLVDKDKPENREDVSFLSGGEKVSGWYYKPENSEPRSCIILSTGLNGTKDGLLENYALEFTKKGHSALTYDYRTYGDSEGEPRQLLSVTKQHQDLKAAIKFIREEKKIESIILWGTSAGAPYGLVVASQDHHIKGVVCQCGSYDHKVDSQKGLKEHGFWFYFRLLPHGIRDKWRGRLGLSRHRIPAYGKQDSKTFIAGDNIFENAEKLTLDSKNFINEVCAAFMFEPHGPDVIEASKEVQCPVLVLVCEKDEIISPESHYRLRDTLGTKLEVVSYPIGHFDIYHGEWFNQAVTTQIEFINKVNSYNLSV